MKFRGFKYAKQLVKKNILQSLFFRMTVKQILRNLLLRITKNNRTLSSFW